MFRDGNVSMYFTRNMKFSSAFSFHSH